MLNYYGKRTLLEKCGPQIRHCLFMFRLITLKQLKCLTTIDKFSCLGGLEVTHQTTVREDSGSMPGSGKYVFIYFLFVVVMFYSFILTTFLSRTFAIPFAMIIQ